MQFAVYRLQGCVRADVLITAVLTLAFISCILLDDQCGRKGRLRVFENMVLRRIFGPRRDEVTGEIA
jgi:hypothetical protein